MKTRKVVLSKIRYILGIVEYEKPAALMKKNSQIISYPIKIVLPYLFILIAYLYDNKNEADDEMLHTGVLWFDTTIFKK